MTDTLNVTYSIVELPALRIAGLRGSLKNPAEVWGRLGSAAGEAMGQPDVSTLAVFDSGVVGGTAGHDGAPYDAALALPDSIPTPEGLTEAEVPAGRYAQCAYIGSYTNLSQSWQQFTEWLSANGHKVGDGVCIEWYRNVHGTVPEDELRTDQYIPLA